MRPSWTVKIISLAVLTLPSACWGWGRDGHRITATIAGQYLTSETQLAITSLLGNESLADVSTWADEIKSDPVYDWAKPLHYANVQPGASGFDLERDCPAQGCVVQAVLNYRERLADHAATPAKRTEALRFLVHFVADVHQPLHVSHARDRGGNDVKVDFFHDRTNLHRLWDSGLLRRTKKDWATYADELLHAITPEQLAEWTNTLDPAEWATESYRLALSHAYAVPKDGKLHQAYFERSIPVIEQRLAMAGVRLAALLNGILGAPSEPLEVKDGQASRITVRVDPRVELMCIIFGLAGNPEYRRAPNYAYARDAREQFGKFEDHPVVRMAGLLRASNGVSYDAVMSMAVHVEDAFGLEPHVPLNSMPEHLDGRWTPEAARQFLDQARGFVEDAKFKEFVDAHRPLYEEAAGRLRSKLAERDYIRWFEGFFGARPGARFYAVPALLNGPNCYAATIRRPDGAEEIYQMLGVWAVDDEGSPVFGDDIVPTVVHEYCHAYVNPVVDRHLDDLKQAGVTIFPHVEEQMRRQAYGSWETMMRESCVRACVVRYLRATEGKIAATAEVLRQRMLHFRWTGELVQVLEEYEANRDRYPTFDSFFPRIVELFNDYAERHYKGQVKTISYGPINRVIQQCKEGVSALVVMPDAIQDKELAERMGAFVGAIHQRFYAAQGILLLRASEVTEETLRAKALVLYGSPSSNAVLNDVAAKCGIVIASDHIKAGDKKFQGENLILITCLPSPYNADLPVLLYTSARDENVIELNSFFHGPTDYVVGRWGPQRRPEILQQGDYTKMGDGRWVISE